MATVSWSGTDQRMPLWKLTLYNPVFWRVQHHSELILQTQNAQSTAKSREEEEDDVPLHGTINEEEARWHRHKLEQMINDLKRSALEPEIREIMGDFILSIKTCCKEIYPPLMIADAQKVLHSMGNPYGLAVWEQTEEVETMLEVSMPEEDLPETDEVVRWESNMEPLSGKSKNTLTSMMEHISEAHYQAAQAAQNLADLSKTCTLANWWQLWSSPWGCWYSWRVHSNQLGNTPHQEGKRTYQKNRDQSKSNTLTKSQCGLAEERICHFSNFILGRNSLLPDKEESRSDK